VNSLDRTFSRKISEGRKLLVPFVTVGFPTLEATPRIVKALAGAGADAVELGIPFSDPLADGPIIQRCSQRALENGVTLEKSLAIAKRLASEVEVPLIAMGYTNPIERFGMDRFAAAAGESGLSGVIVPDLPLDEAPALARALRAAKVHWIPLAAPTTTDARLARLGRAATAFLYCVSVAGTTGAGSLPPGLESFLARARRATRRPLLVGFGVSTPEGAARAARSSDGVIVGSALLDAIASAPDPVAAARTFLARLREALDGLAAARS
jgi:tryptophan synthase alpha chain